MGFYSDTGVSPCLPCDVDTFWTDPQTCTSCGEGKGTAGMKAATSQDMCKGNLSLLACHLKIVEFWF